MTLRSQRAEGVGEEELCPAGGDGGAGATDSVVRGRRTHGRDAQQQPAQDAAGAQGAATGFAAGGAGIRAAGQ